MAWSVSQNKTHSRHTGWVASSNNFKADEWKQAAREALDKFYADRDEKMQKTAAQNREEADALKVDGDSYSTENLDSHEKWEHVTQSIDFNAKGTKDFHSNRHFFFYWNCRLSLLLGVISTEDVW